MTDDRSAADRNAPTDSNGRDGSGRDVARREFLKRASAGAFLPAFTGLDGEAGDEPLSASEAAAPGSTAGVEAETFSVEKPSAIRNYPTYDGDGNQTGSQSFRVVRETGNCCENYLATTPNGEILDMGGIYLLYSDDEGQSWTAIKPPQPYPLQTSEGCVSAAPNGDIVAVDWAPYDGDRLIAYKYAAAEDTWYYAETPVKPAFYDRPWLAVIPGPIEVAGQTLPYIVVQRGGVVGSNQLLVALDGLNYVPMSSRYVDSLVNGSVEQYLDPAGGRMVDWTQPQTETGITPLGDGGALGTGTTTSTDTPATGCDRTLLAGGPASDLQWACFDTPAEGGFPDGRTLADSRGYLHQVEFTTQDTFVYRTSTDGGKSWTEHTQTLPGNYRMTDGALSLYDFKAHGGLDATAIVVHATDAEAGVDQDIIYRFQNAVAGPIETEVLYVGRADVSYVSGVSTAERFDFQTMGFLPDGRIVVSFADLESSDPQIAIELPESRASSPAFEVFGTREDSGSAFTGGQVDEITITVQASKPVDVRDTIPIEWEVPDANPNVETVDVRSEAGVKHVHLKPTDPTRGLKRSYYVRAPDDPAATGPYDFGPVEVRAEGTGAWQTVEGTTDTNMVVGQQT